MGGVPSDQDLLVLHGDRVHDDPSRLPKRVPRGGEDLFVEAAADEHRVGSRCVGECFGSGTEERQAMPDAVSAGVGGQPFGPVRVLLEGDDAAPVVGAEPFDGDAPGPGADVPEKLRPCGFESRHGHRPDRGLGDLAVVRVDVVVASGHPTAPRSDTVDGHDVERVDGRVCPGLGGRGPDPLVRSAELFEHGHR